MSAGLKCFWSAGLTQPKLKFGARSAPREQAAANDDAALTPAPSDGAEESSSSDSDSDDDYDPMA